MLAEWALAAEGSSFALYLLQSPALLAALQGIHLLALALLGGAALIADLRLIGLGLINHSVATLHRTARPWFYGGAVLLVLSGLALWSVAATTLTAQPLFRLKMGLLLLTLLYAVTIRDAVIAGAIRVFRGPRLSVRLAGLGSLLLWLAVAAVGRYQSYAVPLS